MKYPKLVRKDVCKIPVTLILDNEDLDEDGAPVEAIKINAKCNYQSSSKRHYTDKENFIETSGSLYFSDDIVPDLNEITSGYCIIFNEKREIYKGTKARNPDGSVNYVRIELK